MNYVEDKDMSNLRSFNRLAEIGSMLLRIIQIKFHQRLSLQITLGCFILSIAGCAHQAYEGGRKSADEVAVLSDSFTMSPRWKNRAAIHGIGDKSLMMPEQVEVMPGNYTVQVACFYTSIMSMFQDSKLTAIDFNAEAGHTYKLYCRVKGRYVNAWIKDLKTGEIAGGKKPQAFYSKMSSYRYFRFHY